MPSIEMAVSQTGAWIASRKNGGRKANVISVANSSGKAGRSRIASRLPPTRPIACAVTSTDHASAPP